MEKLFNKTINSLADMVGVREQKHRVILSNVANIDTPGFKPSELTFAKAFQSAKGSQLGLTQTDPAHLPGAKRKSGSLDYEITESDEQVKLDTEMASLSENQLLYNATVEILAKKFRGIRSTLSETK